MRRALNIWTPKGWWRFWYKRSSPPATRTIPAAVDFILMEAVVLRLELAALFREPTCTGLKAAFKASCWCASKVSLASNVRKLRNGSPPRAFVLCGIRLGAATKVVDKAATASHALRRFESIIDASALRLPVSIEVDPEQTGREIGRRGIWCWKCRYGGRCVARECCNGLSGGDRVELES
jgi:hypothetical protein